MVAAPLPPALQELVARGRVHRESLTPLGDGNRDRRDRSRSSWSARLTDGRTAKLTVGPTLAPLAERHAAFARACPALVPPLLFLESSPHGEVLAEEFFAGAPLDHAPDDTARAAFAHACALLAATERRSTDDARRTEWLAWTTSLLATPAWSEAERAALAELVLPRLFSALTTEPATIRWTNGDVVSPNMLVSERGGVRLVDCEFAQATHFWREDAARFHTLSPIARRSPNLFTAALPDPGPAWHLFFWLRQWQLENAQNSADYVARMRPSRLAVIRRLAEVTLDGAIPHWSVPAVAVHSHLESARWSPHDGRVVEFRGWCHLPTAPALRAVVLSAGPVRLAEAPLTARADVQAHFGGSVGAALSGFAISGAVAGADAEVMLSALTGDGELLPFHRVRAGELPGRVAAVHDYPAWAARHDPPPPAPASIPDGPLFSVLLPVYRTPPALLHACIGSVLAQHYPRWELCIVDDASGSPALTGLLEDYARADSRIRLLPRAQNGGIARATNDALAAARGEFIVLLDHDDELRPHALLEFARALAQAPHTDLLYSDEDKIAADGARVTPFLKPAFSPEFLLGVMYFGHLLSVRTAVARRVGGYDPAFDGVQDFEFALRVTEHTRAIVHVPQILYHWRQTATSSALHGNVKGDMDARQAAAVQAHLQRVGRAERAVALGGHRVRLDPVSPPTVALVRGEPSDLLAEAARSTADVLLLIAPGLATPEPETQARLAAAAGRPDAGLVAPVLVSADGRVLDAGWIVHDGYFSPLMRGFDAAGDGFNGSLSCTREVSGVAPHCVAIHRERLLAAAPPRSSDWPSLLLHLAQRGYFHRVVGAARVVAADAEASPCRADTLVERFYHPWFDARNGDYALRPDWPSPIPLWHLDTPAPPPQGAGALHWRGWCHWPGRTLREIRLQLTADFSWSATLGLPRPDVPAQLGDATAGQSGFTARVRLPPGRYLITATAMAEDGASCRLFTHATEVTVWQNWRYAFAATPEELLAFQFLAGPSRLPQPLPVVQPRASRSDGPRFAIVTPSFQQAQFLDQCMQSVLSQEGVSLDYVVQDGGSTDGSRDIIAAHAARLHAWASEPDAGQADAIARGFARTRGAPEDLMAWLNSDDFYLPGTLATVAEFFARHPEVDVIYGHRGVVDEQGRLIGRWLMPPHDDHVLRLNDFIPQETLFWRRRLWDRVGGLDTSLRFAMDWDLLLRFQAAGAQIVRLPIMLACFRVHGLQKTSAAMHDIGQTEIDWLRTRTHGRYVAPDELARNVRLIRYLRRSARQEWWRSLAGL